MNTDTNNIMDFSKIDVIDMCYFLNGRADLSTNNYLKKISPLLFSKVEMYEYIKSKSDDFDKFKFQLVFDEICEYCFVYMDFYRVVKVNGKFVTKNVVDYEVDYDIKFQNPTEHILKTLELNKGLSVYNQRIVEFIEIAEELYQTVCEQAPGNTLEVPPKQKPFAGLLMELNDDQLEKLFNFLTTGQKHKANYYRNPYINKEKTDRQSFDYIFGKDKEKTENFKPIEWLATKQQLRELLTGLQKEIKYNRQNPETRELSNEIVRQTPNYFLKDKTPLKLAGNKLLSSWGSEDIKGFLATI